MGILNDFKKINNFTRNVCKEGPKPIEPCFVKNIKNRKIRWKVGSVNGPEIIYVTLYNRGKIGTRK